MTKPSSHYTTANSLRLHYLEAGEGDPILLLHGFPTSSHLYRNILPTLAKTMSRIQGSHPGAELTALPNCGHFLQEDEPERVAELIAGFFNSNPKTRRKQQAAPAPS
jgi:pimeloyl-ACP methyl ester carboxylesterase